MNTLRHNKARVITGLAAIPLIALFSAGSGYAFTDMNDSASQGDVVKSLQKRIDSLEVRFEKQEVARIDEKKMALDWSRGLFLNADFGLPDLSGTKFRAGYMIKRKHKDGTEYTISPVMQLGPVTALQSIYINHGDPNAPMPSGSTMELGFGLQKSARIFDKVSYSTAWYLHMLPEFPDQSFAKLFAIGWGWDNSINFWFDEKNAIGFGFGSKMMIAKNMNNSWTKTLSGKGSDSFTLTMMSNTYLQYTYYFAKHNGKSRK